MRRNRNLLSVKQAGLCKNRSLFSLYRVELRRLLLSKTAGAAVVLSLLAPLLGYTVDGYNTGMADIYIANPVLSAASASAMLWAVIMILETSRLHRSTVDLLTDAAASPRVLSVARLAAMMTVSAAAALLCACVYLPYTKMKMEYLFDTVFYFANYLILVLPTGWISILFAESFYQITRRVELAVFLYAGLAYFSLSSYASDDYFMRWLNPFVIAYSDGFTSWWFLRIGFYTRMLWLCIALALWLLSMMCVRKYEKNIAVSFFRGLRKVCLPILAVFFAVSGAGLWICQPFIDHELDLDEDSWIDTPTTDTSANRYYIRTDPVTGRVSGRAEYDVKKPYTGEDKLFLNPGYQISRMTYNGKEVAFRTVKDDLNGLRSTYFTLPDAAEGTLVIEYGGLPTQMRTAAPYMISAMVDWDYIQLGQRSAAPLTNYVCKDGDLVEITIPKALTPFLNDMPMTEGTEQKNGMKTWREENVQGGIGRFTAGRYKTDSFTAAGTDIDFRYGEAYQEPVTEYDIRQAVTDVFEYCTRHYGELGFVEDQTMAMQQVSALLMGGQAHEGYLEWFEMVLSPMTLGDAERGASATEVFIHEMIHQWWGGYGLVCSYEDELWSEEGLTVYAVYRLVKEKYGALYAKQYYTDEWQKKAAEQDRNFYNRHPQYLDKLPEKYREQLVKVNESTNKYSRMPLMILKAEKLVGGEEKMDKILQKMYADKEAFRESPCTYQDFLDYCGLKEQDLDLTDGDYGFVKEGAGA